MHHGYFQDNTPAYFVNVANQSVQRNAVVTHVWLANDDGSATAHLTAKPLPYTIPPDHEWETWVLEADVPPGTTDVYTSARVRLSGDVELASEKRENVPDEGYVPG